MTHNPIIVALDVENVEDARKLTAKLGDSVEFYKVGMELYASAGPAYLDELAAQGKKIFLDMKFYEVAKHVTLTNHMYNAQALTMSKKTWDKLSEEERGIIRQAAAEMAPYQREASRELSAEALGRLKEEGVEVVELPPEELAEMRERVQPVVDKYTKEIGADLVGEIRAEVAKVRGKG